MALEQWEIDLRKQLENISAPPKILKVSTLKASTLKEDTKEPNRLLNLLIVLFFILAGFFLLDFQTDFLNNFFHNKTNKPKVQLEQKIEVEEEALKGKEDKTAEILEKINQQEKKIFLLGVVVNENTIILKNGFGKKDLLTVTKDWKLKKYPRYINMSEKDKEYFNSIQSN